MTQISYTLKNIYPTLAIIEDPNPPAYEAVPVSEDAEAAAPLSQPKAITSSLRAINRLLFSVAGWKANFRGIVCAFAIVVAQTFVAAIFSAVPFVGLVGSLLTSLALVQLETAWVHIVISSPSTAPFYRRLPPFRKTFEATCIPVFASWATRALSGGIPLLVAGLLGIKLWEPSHGKDIPKYDSSVSWKGPIIALISLALYVVLVIPTKVILVRVQASLLPPEEDAIVPFDRSFEGTVEPAIVGGKGYVTWRDSLRTFSRASWIRLYAMYLKIFLVEIAFWALFMGAIVPQILLLSKKSDKAN